MNTRVQTPQTAAVAAALPLHFTTTPLGTVYRKCACGGSGGDCEECKKKQTSESPGVPVAAPAAAPPLGNGVLRSPGPLPDSSPRTSLEPRLGHDFSRVRVDAVRSPAVQNPLRISQPGDAAEQEADRVAGQIMRLPGPAGTGKTLGLRQIPALHMQPWFPGSELNLHRQPDNEDEKSQAGGGAVDNDMPKPDDMTQCPAPVNVQHDREEGLQRKFMDGEKERTAKQISGQRPAVASSVEELMNEGGGRPLSSTARSFFEPRFGYAFDHVRVHTDERAAASARAVYARAYTVGNHIVFGERQYAPDNPAGRHLIAHELTHVLQQKPAQPLAMSSDHVNPPLRIGNQGKGTTALQRWSIGDPVPDINTIVCDGSDRVTTQLNATGNADQTRCLRDCIEAHEQSHRSDALAEKATICKGIAGGKTVRPDAGAQQKATEIKASNVEIGCLTPQVDKVGEVCKGIIQARITQMEGYRDSFK